MVVFKLMTSELTVKARLLIIIAPKKQIRTFKMSVLLSKATFNVFSSPESLKTFSNLQRGQWWDHVWRLYG